MGGNEYVAGDRVQIRSQMIVLDKREIVQSSE